MAQNAYLGMRYHLFLGAETPAQVVMMDRRLLDPRRPVEEPSKFEKEERLLQYQPHLPVVPTQVLSYYKVALLFAIFNFVAYESNLSG